MAGMSLPEVNCLRSDFGVLSHFHQVPPDSDWTTWLLLGGRGAGKTRAGAEWVRGLALGVSPFADKPVSPIALIGETEHDAREVMVEGIKNDPAASSGITNGDNSAWSTKEAEYLGALDAAMDKAFSDAAKGIGLPNEGFVISAQPSSGTRLIYGLLEARAAYTPANAEVFTVVLEIDQD